MSKHVVGIGGVFFRAKDPKALQAWYEEHLGLPRADHGGITFTGDGGQTVWAAFAHDTKYFGTPQHCMINYRVKNLDAALKDLRAAGVPVDDKIDEYDFGRFGWATDPEGNRFELWEPKD